MGGEGDSEESPRPTALLCPPTINTSISLFSVKLVQLALFHPIFPLKSDPVHSMIPSAGFVSLDRLKRTSPLKVELDIVALLMMLSINVPPLARLSILIEVLDVSASLCLVIARWIRVATGSCVEAALVVLEGAFRDREARISLVISLFKLSISI